MKKITLLLAVCLMGISAFQSGNVNAQIIGESTDFPQVGNTFIVVNDSNMNFSVVAPGNSGSSIVWKFDTLGTVALETTVDTIACAAKSGVYASLFPGATSEITYSLGNLQTAYINNASSELQLWGVVELVNTHPFPFVYRPSAQELYSFPLNFGSTWASAFAYRFQVPVRDSIFDSLRVLSFVLDSCAVDAYGTCTTPYGTESVLRKKDRQLTLDSTFLYDTVTSMWNFLYKSITIDTTYTWVAKNLGYPLVSMQIKNGKVLVASWLKKTSTGIDQITDKAGSLVYPNPANNILNIKLASCQNGSVAIMDVTGRQISTTEFSNQFANVNTSALPAGMYFYRIADKTGNFIDAGKFTVIR